MEDGTTSPEQAIPAGNESLQPKCRNGRPQTERGWTRKHSAELYRLLAENVQDVMWALDQDLQYVYVSPSASNLRGCTPEEVLACSIADVLTPDSYRKAMQIFERELALELSGQRHGPDWSIQLELEMVRKDGSVIWTEVNVGIIYDESDRPIGLLGITRDIKGRKRIEAALKESEERYRVLAENAHDVIWMRDLDFKAIYLSPSVKRLRGYTAEEAMQQSFQDMLTPASFQYAMQVFDRERQDKEKNGLPAATWSVTLELEVVCKDGSTKVTENTINLLYNPAGEVIGLMGITRDIDQRKKAEDALRERQARLDSIFRVAPVGIGVVVERVLVEVNDRICEMTGYARSELIGQSTRKLYLSQQDFESIAVDKCNQIKTWDWGYEETRWQQKDGGIMDILLSYTPINPGDHSARVTFTALDITERKRADAELKRHRDRLEELVKERTYELLQANMRLHREIAVRKRSEERLRAGEIEHKERRKALEEMNVALKILLRQHQEDKENLEHNLVANINTSLLVYLDKLKSSGLRNDQLRLMSEIERQLKKVSTSFIRDLTSEHLGLSPSEIKVATLIKEGRSSKEIAELLNVSLNAVLFHRNNLRTKLGLKDSKVNLMTYLQHYDQD